jgi:RNA polymerase sigma factor (sigma-70 family)
MTRPSTIVAHLRTGGPTDHELVAKFAAGRDEGAFELLVWRHAGMVLRTCRSVLRDHQAAEDAAQATFLALARQAASVGRRGTVAGWLYRVARRIAARAVDRRSRIPTASTDGLDHFPEPTAEPESDLAGRLLDELDRLPDKYRAPVLLCFFDGLSHADAAKRLGWPIGSVAGRLARAKDRLRRRLAAHRAAGIGALLATGVATPAFVGATTRAALAFAVKDLGGVSPAVLQLATREIQSMVATKMQWAAALVFGGVLTLGGVWAGGQAPPGAPPAKAPPGGAPKGADDQTDLAKQQAENRRRLEEFDRLSRDFVALQALMNQMTTDPKRAKADGERLKKLTDEWLTPMNKKLRDELGLRPDRPVPPPEAVEDGGEARKLDGEYAVVTLELGGKAAPVDKVRGMRWTISAGEIKATDPDGATGQFTFRLNSKKSPKEIDLTSSPGRNTLLGIYRLEGGRLEICFIEDAKGDKRPKDFEGDEPRRARIVLERITMPSM